MRARRNALRAVLSATVLSPLAACNEPPDDAETMLAVVTRPLMRAAPAGEKPSQKLSHPAALTS